MINKEYADASLWVWPMFYLGVGFSQAAVVVLVVHYIQSIRERISTGRIHRVLGEGVIALLSIPAIAAFFATAFSLRLIHGSSFPASVVFGTVVSAAALAAAYYLRRR